MDTLWRHKNFCMPAREAQGSTYELHESLLSVPVTLQPGWCFHGSF